MVSALRDFLRRSVNISGGCPRGSASQHPSACLHPSVAEKLVAGEMEYMKRGRLRRIFPDAGSARPGHHHERLLRGAANRAAVRPLLSRRGRSLPASASGVDTHCDSMSPLRRGVVTEIYLCGVRFCARKH
eukprot:COSAG01_NODE_32898_length_573_cov_1.616034_1_plen_131_part_00